MRVLAWASLVSLLMLWPAAGAGGDNGTDEPAGDEFPTPVFENAFVAPFDDSGLPATVEARVAQTIAAQDAALATAVTEGLNRVARLDEVSPTPTSLADDEVRAPVFRRGGAPRPAATSTPVPAATPGLTATPVSGSGIDRCPPGMVIHISNMPSYSVCYPEGWRVGGDGQRWRFVDPAAAGYVEVKPVTAPAGSDAAALFERFRQEVAAAVAPRLVFYAVDDSYERYGLTYEYLHDVSPPADCPERVTAKVRLAERRADATTGYAVIFAVCDRFSEEYEVLKIGVLSGFREGSP